jgi:tRNA 2-thiouridine synthesizing protein A
MMDTIAITLDARGLSCPQPAFLAKQKLAELKCGTLNVLLDSATSRDNVSRIARNAGWKITEEQEAGVFRLVLTK